MPDAGESRLMSRRATVTLLGHAIRVTESVRASVETTNDYFESNRLTDEDREAVKASLLFVDSHAGCAVDVNVNPAVGRSGRSRIELFGHVVAREPGWSSWDGWAETSSERWLEASRLFNVHFPLFLSELLDDVHGGNANTALAHWGESLDWMVDATGMVGRMLVCSQDPGKLRTAATAAKSAETAHWLELTAGHWAAVRGWIEGVVLYGAEDWAYLSEHRASVAAGREARTPVGELHGMIPLHPKLVETLEAGGWTWCVDSQDEKAFTRFEARAEVER